MYDFSGLLDTLEQLGIKKGDTLYVSSDITLLLSEAQKKEGVTAGERYAYLNALVDTLKEAVGGKGTLLFPVFTWSFCKGVPFDVKTTKGEVGTLNNWILQNRSDFTRTQHPMYSFMVWGDKTQLYTDLDNTDCWGQNSPFAYLYSTGAKMLLFNVSLQRGFTFFHYVERQTHVPYRYLKSFRGEYKDANGEVTNRMYTMFVRDLDIESEEYLPDSMLEEPGAMVAAQWGNQTLKAIDLKAAYDIVADDLKNNGGAQCYKFGNYELDWTKGQTHPNQLTAG